MPKIELKGIIQQVSSIYTVGQNETKYQTFSLLVPGYIDRYGEKRSQDELWRINVSGARVDRFSLSKDFENAKADVEVFINSASVVKDGVVKSFINANLASIEIRN